MILKHGEKDGRGSNQEILNPSEATFQQQVQPLLAEAYEMAVKRHAGKSPSTLG
jgi:hypothetical protein